MRGLLKWVVWLNLAALAILAFVYPHLVVSPGKLAEGHHKLTQDCFACHAPMLGPSSSRCTNCHVVKEIGILTTEGAPITTKKTKVGFHQTLTQTACVECHTEHLGIGVRHVKPRFSHKLLDTATQRNCTACHAKPSDDLHRPLSGNCLQCHSTQGWKPATFKHDLLTQIQRQDCAACHKAKTPKDDLHRGVNANCGACHKTDRWKPAIFDHAKLFVFDDHHKRCTTCHRTPDYKQYTCYFCHEHTPAKVRKEHLEEGIGNFEKCIDCHRSADEDEAKRAWRSLRRGTPNLEQPSIERSWWKRNHDDD